jgi:hypothetical protein
VYREIEALGQGAGVQSERVSARSGQEFVRYRLPVSEAARVLRGIERELPGEVTSSVRACVRQFGKDTSELLSCVYRTRPMLHAAPGEALDFTCSVAEADEPAPCDAPPLTAPRPRTKRAEKKRTAALSELRAQIRERLDAQKRDAKRVMPTPAPRYDEVFAEGQRMLDELAGDPLDAEELEARFSNEIWHSRGRAEAELP